MDGGMDQEARRRIKGRESAIIDTLIASPRSLLHQSWSTSLTSFAQRTDERASIATSLYAETARFLSGSDLSVTRAMRHNLAGNRARLRQRETRSEGRV
jgi:hypothetical protein